MRGVALVFLLNGFVLSGCNSSVVNIHGKDRQVFFPEGEIEMNLGKESDKRAKGKYVTLSAGYVRSEGQFTQDLSDTESVNVDGAYIDGPVTLDNDASLDVGYVRGVYHSLPSDALEWFAGAGLALVDMELTTSTDSQQSTFSETLLSAHGLLGMGYHFTPMLGIEGNLAVYLPAMGLFTSASLIEQRLLLTVTPHESLKVYAGYRRWLYGNERNDTLSERSEINMEFSGPTAGVVLRF